MIIAIDGPGAAGKGTLARHLADALDLAYLDTGLLYRAVAAKVLSDGGDPANPAVAAAAARSTTVADLDRPELRDEAVGQGASQVAAMPAVRAALLDLQRRFAAQTAEDKRGAVLDGRDIGTVVCPEADVKLFVTASLEARVARRQKELLARGEAGIYARVKQEMQERDTRDSSRATAPLKPAPDAVILDTTEMDADGAFRAAMDIIATRAAAPPA